MPIGKARELLRGRRSKAIARDPDSVEAYEQGWYALLVRQASEEDGQEDGESPRSPVGAADSKRPDEVAVAGLEAAPPCPTTLVDPPPEAPAEDRETRRDPPPKRPAPARADRAARPSRPDPSSIRIGVRRLDEPESVYLRYLTSSLHRDFFRSDLWPISGSFTPVDLWRANHLGAGWDIGLVERFMRVSASAAEELVASAPRNAQPGSPERRAWIVRFLSADWVQEFGVGRVSKTLHPLLPELVADLDPEMMPWASRAWLGLDGPKDTEAPGQWLETCEVLEDVLVLRGQQLGQIVRRLRHVAPSLAPIGRFGPILAAFWESYWAEIAQAERRPRTRPRASTPRASRTTVPQGLPDAEPAATAAGRAPKRPHGHPIRSDDPDRPQDGRETGRHDPEGPRAEGSTRARGVDGRTGL